MARWWRWLTRQPVTLEIRGSKPLRVATKVDSQYLVAENLGVEEETIESLYLATGFWG